MERFKACEKEMKTKAFSKEGLSAAQKLDPREAAKVELTNWISNMVDELARQIEHSEAELESLQGVVKKKKDSSKADRAEQLETLNERRRWHQGKLEVIQRMLDNGNLDTDSVNEVKEDISYYVESNTVSPGSAWDGQIRRPLNPHRAGIGGGFRGGPGHLRHVEPDGRGRYVRRGSGRHPIVPRLCFCGG